VSRLVPLLRQGADDLEQLLLESARDDAPPDGAARAETLAALRAASVTAAATGAGVFGLKWLESLGPIATKWMAIGLMGTSAVLATHLAVGILAAAPESPLPSASVLTSPLATGAPHVLAPAPEKPAARRVEVAVTAVPPPPSGTLPAAHRAIGGAVAPVAASVGAPGSVVGVEPTNASERVVAPTTVATLPLVASGASTAPVSPAPTSLGDEVALLERARESLTASRPSDALASLDAYQARFPSGDLREEAVLLRVRALLAAGHAADARRLADDFARKNPASTYAPRIRALLDRKP
jgi:hypothetical protein